MMEFVVGICLMISLANKFYKIVSHGLHFIGMLIFGVRLITLVNEWGHINLYTNYHVPTSSFGPLRNGVFMQYDLYLVLHQERNTL